MGVGFYLIWVTKVLWDNIGRIVTIWRDDFKYRDQD